MGKKWFIISLVMVLTVMAGVNFSGDCLAQGKVIGLLLDGYQKNCQVLRNGKECQLIKGLELFEGDLIIKTPDIKDLKIWYFPYAGRKIESKTQLRMIFTPPQKETDLVKKFLAIIEFEKEHVLYNGSSRGNQFYNSMKVQGDLFACGPFPEATIFAQGEIRFYTGEGDSDLLVLYDADKKELSRTRLENGKVSLGEGGVKLNPGQIYYWRLGNQCPYIRVKVLRPELEQEITTALGQIATDGGNEIEVKLKQAAFLRAISDVYPDQIDMDWLSYEMLRDVVFSQDHISQEELTKIEFYLAEIFADKIKYAAE
jgi:hypothetical protein